MLMLGFESVALVTFDLQVKGDSTRPRAHGLHFGVCATPGAIIQFLLKQAEGRMHLSFHSLFALAPLPSPSCLCFCVCFVLCWFLFAFLFLGFRIVEL